MPCRFWRPRKRLSIDVVLHTSRFSEQCFFNSRNVGLVTPKIIYLCHLKNLFWIKVSKKKINLILKTEALSVSILKNTKYTYLVESLSYTSPFTTHLYLLALVYSRNSDYLIPLSERTSVYRGSRGSGRSACAPNKNLKERLRSCG